MPIRHLLALLAICTATCSRFWWEYLPDVDPLHLPPQVQWLVEAEPALGLVQTRRDMRLLGPVRSLAVTTSTQFDPGKPPVVRREMYRYDKAGHLLEMSSGPSDWVTTTAYLFDSHGRLTSEKWSNAAAQSTETLAYSRNDRGFLTSDGLNHWRYDTQGRLVHYQPHRNEAMNAEDFTYTYDSRGRLAKLTRRFCDKATEETTGRFVQAISRYSYDGAGTKITADGHGSYRVVRDSKGRIAKLCVSGSPYAFYGRDYVETITYDRAGRPTKIVINAPDPKVVQVYTYDRYANLLGCQIETTKEGRTERRSGITWSYKYDDHGNWIEASGSSMTMTRELEYYD